MRSLLLFLLGIVIGSLSQILLSIAFEHRLRLLYRKIGAWMAYARTFFRKGGGVVGQPDAYRVGRLQVPCVVLEGTPREAYRRQNLTAVVSDAELMVPPDLAAVVKATTQRQESIAQRMGHPTYFNGPMVALEGWGRTRTPKVERDVLRLRFLRTDYYTFLSTTMSQYESIDSESGFATIRDLYISGRSYRMPNPNIATSFGVNLALITSDRFTLFARRGMSGLSNYSGRLAVPVGESVHPEFDKWGQHNVDLFLTVMRGAHEELNLDIAEDEIEMYTLAVDTTWYFYGMTGAIFCESHSRDDVIAMRSVGTKDRWEHDDLHFVPFDPASVAKFVYSQGGGLQFTPASLVSVTQALISRYGEGKVMDAFKRVA